MRFKTLSTLALAGLLTVGIAGCTSSSPNSPQETEEPTRELSGQIQVNDDTMVTYESVELVPDEDILELRELNPEIGAFELGYIPLYFTVTVDSFEKDPEKLLADINTSVFPVAEDGAQVGTLPVSAGDCDSTKLLGRDGTDKLSYCKVIMLEPEKNPEKVGLTDFDSKQVFTDSKIPAKEKKESTPKED